MSEPFMAAQVLKELVINELSRHEELHPLELKLVREIARIVREFEKELDKADAHMFSEIDE